MKRHYESMIVFDGTLTDDVLQKEQHQIEEFLKGVADFEKTDVWGKRQLAYPIRKKRTGYYCLFLYEGEGAAVSGLEKHIRLNTAVLRHLSVLRNLKNEAAKVAAAARQAKMDSQQERKEKE